MTAAVPIKLFLAQEFCPLLRISNDPTHVFEIDLGPRAIHFDPAALTSQVAAIDDGDVEERRKLDAFLQPLLVTLNGPHALVAEVVHKLPQTLLVGGADHACCELHQHVSGDPSS